MNICINFGAKLRAARKAAGLTQAQLAAALGTTLAYVRRLERGQENPPLLTCIEAARMCGADFIFDFCEPAERPAAPLVHLFAVAGRA